MKTTKANDTPQKIADDMTQWFNTGKSDFESWQSTLKDILDMSSKLIDTGFIERLSEVGLDWASEDIDQYTMNIASAVRGLKSSLDMIDPNNKAIWGFIREISTTEV